MRVQTAGALKAPGSWPGGHNGNVSILPNLPASFAEAEYSQAGVPTARSSQHQGLAGSAVLIRARAWL